MLLPFLARAFTGGAEQGAALTCFTDGTSLSSIIFLLSMTAIKAGSCFRCSGEE